MNIQGLENLKKYKFIQKIKTLPFVQKVILFGSRARGTNQLKSDIDLAIVCPQATPSQWHEILEIIEQADTLLVIDCVQLDKASHEFKQRILKDGIEL
ncbi:nucleotidyltransferase domain-containing protein [Candidatus Babeliales bacterium]|nr:nucleotidyltransferase domain-containing protein [Candidatus Babeliales bacterium]